MHAGGLRIFHTYSHISLYSAVCAVSTSDPLLVNGNCTLGGTLVGGTSCNVECISGYSPVSGSSQFTCSTNGTLTETPTVSCTKATTCDAQVGVEFTCGPNTTVNIGQNCTLPGGCTSSFCCTPGLFQP